MANLVQVQEQKQEQQDFMDGILEVREPAEEPADAKLDESFEAKPDEGVDPVVDVKDPAAQNSDDASTKAKKDTEKPANDLGLEPEVTLTPEQINEQLRLQIVEMSSKLNYPTDAKVADFVASKPAEDAKAGVVAEEQQLAVLENFLTDEELDRLIDEPQLINTALQRAGKAILSQVQSAQANIGELVAQEIQRQRVVDEVVTNFYENNKDLLPYAKYVQYTMMDIEAKHRDKGVDVIFAETAKECRKRLGLKNPGLKVTDAERPAFAGSRRSVGTRMKGKDELFDANAADMF